MFRPIPPRDLLRLWFRTGFMLFEAQSVIALRLMGMAGAWPLPPSEPRRMVSEKVKAARTGAKAAGKAVLAGRNAARVAEAALAPTARRTSGNVKRLTRRGPGQPA